MPSWKEVREKEKQANLQRKSDRREVQLQQMTTEQLEIYDEAHRIFKIEKINEQRAEKQIQKSRAQQAKPLIIDLAYYELMKPAEIKSLHQQIMFCYSISLKSLNPLKMSLYNYKEQVLEMQKVHGFDDWIIDKTDTTLDEQIKGLRENGKDVPYIYLSGDAETEISSFDVSKIYIIGGLVDRNRHKNAALNRANELGIPSVKINLKQFAQLKSSQIIAVNHIFEMMTKLNENGDLKEAVLEVLPGRKVQKAK
ncbi:tRNA (guanine9-N1)-methyltransferase [Spironucleus salmonicida]|uniref:tRNA (guanine(9)-N(1))-methyltransferase n=1 Tax=Spironucleus salmonicida TaxID=348837 RepID=V6LBF8_9EUKA|nr:tRNA (guanine9-N1)-methyltransferase [Spironucleus salmonicida]|eukprot:EST41790.1 tRNA (Guanine-1)-methyltransferase family protein [Spironucleus salmonicida]